MEGSRSANCRIHWIWGQVKPFGVYGGLQTWNCWPRTTNMMSMKTYPSSLMDEVGVGIFFGMGRPADCTIYCVWGQLKPFGGYGGLQTRDCWPRTTHMMHIKKFPSSLMNEVAIGNKFGRGRLADCTIYCFWGQVMPFEGYTLL